MTGSCMAFVHKVTNSSFCPAGSDVFSMCKYLNTEQQFIQNLFSEQLRKTQLPIVRFISHPLDFFWCMTSFDLFPVISHLLCVDTNTGHSTVSAILGAEKRPHPSCWASILQRFTEVKVQDPCTENSCWDNYLQWPQNPVLSHCFSRIS